MNDAKERIEHGERAMTLKLPAWETDPNTLRCQCCSRPMRVKEDYGTSADATPSTDYCDCCLVEGRWVEPDVTMQELIDRCVQIWVDHDIANEVEARTYFEQLFPTLMRWAA